jgi:hypothetical protein
LNQLVGLFMSYSDHDTTTLTDYNRKEKEKEKVWQKEMRKKSKKGETERWKVELLDIYANRDREENR